ncbi:MAG: hypothetical protein IR160_03630 [Salinibacterium sp.]|nr:hypothetical protein [Salinibacterium sp.]MBF0671658.1 hypothetical protein [Salinibacterium sp.]
MSALVIESTTMLFAILRAAEDAEFDPNTVTPGVIGFIATFLVAAAVVFIAIDMNRRVRRTRYRSEIREKLAAEQAEQAEQKPDASA